jgi:RNA polymerase sigma-70 factor (ECF subfamily)
MTLARAKRGDSRARRDLVERYQVPVFALLSRMLRTRDRAAVEDLAQETFLRVFVALPRFEPKGPARLSTWVLKIASNLAIDELRKRRPETVAVDASAVQIPAEARADAQAERRLLAAVLERAVDELPPEFRAAFVLREVHQLEYAEIASTLELDLGTVKSRLSRARKRLRVLLKEAYDG